MMSSKTRKKANNLNGQIYNDDNYLPAKLIEDITSRKVSSEDSLETILGYRKVVGPTDWSLHTCKNGCNIAHLVVESKKVSLAKRLLSHPKLSEGAKSMMRKNKKLTTGTMKYFTYIIHHPI